MKEQSANVNMSLPKNRYPHDFKRWHDIRIDEYATKKRACMIGRPDELLQVIDGKRLKVLQVENRMYIPDRNTTV